MFPDNRIANQDVRVLVVDDEPSIVDFIEGVLLENGYQVESFLDPTEVVTVLGKRQFDLALVDINMPQMNGTELSRVIMESARDTEIIIITGVPDEQNLDPSLAMGITHFLFKPFNESQLKYSVYAALHHKRLRNAYLSSSSSQVKGSGLVGVSMSIRDIREEIFSLASIDLPVLILGCSGTGKEVIAHDIHRNSERSGKKFLPVNCAVLGSLAESELFGHSRGAFTGATSATTGFIGAADGGSLFFDEVGELPLEVQAKLLRFLDGGEYYRVGESTIRKVDVRIIAATNCDLNKMCAEGTFREDLYYRLSGGTIKTAPLNERKTDIFPLVWHFLEMFGTAKNVTYEISADAIARLVEHDWPGNVRQLKQELYKISQMAPNRKLTYTDVCRVLGEGTPDKQLTYKEAKGQALLEFDREYLMRTLAMSQGSLKEALRISGMHKKNFYTKIKGLGIAMRDFRQPGSG